MTQIIFITGEGYFGIRTVKWINQVMIDQVGAASG
jgi:hypothetical protein